MPNDSIDAKGMRVKALGARGRESLGCKGARPLMSMHAGGWNCSYTWYSKHLFVATRITNDSIDAKGTR